MAYGLAAAEDAKFKLEPGERPPRARRRIEVGDGHALTQFYDVLDRSTHELSRTAHEELAEEQAATRFRDHLKKNELAYGDKPLGEWYVPYRGEPAFAMLEKNLPAK